jgi:hypothetical protein
MKKLFFILAFVALGVTASAQRVIIDTLKGNEVVNFAAMQNASQVQVLCTELGGTADGTIRLEASVDGISWEVLLSTDGVYHFYPNDTFTIVDDGVLIVNIKDDPFLYHRISGDGEATDTTIVTIKWSK